MMEAQATTRRDLETALIEKCWKDPEFKKTGPERPEGHAGTPHRPEATRTADGLHT